MLHCSSRSISYCWEIISVCDVNVSSGAIPLHNPLSFQSVPQNPCPTCQRNSATLVLFRGKNTDILALTFHPFLSQNAETPSRLLCFLLKVNKDPQAHAVPCCILKPVIVLPSNWGKGYSNEPATDCLTYSLFYQYTFTGKFFVI